MKLSKRKLEWREGQYTGCKFVELHEGQLFTDGATERNIVLLYPSGRRTNGNGYTDAEFIERIEIHHRDSAGCTAYYVDHGSNDAITFESDYKTGAPAPLPWMMKIQQDGATQMCMKGAFTAHHYQAFELRGFKP
jgi:hypothetical protein